MLDKVTEDRLRAKIKDALAARRDAEGNLPEHLLVSDIAEEISVSRDDDDFVQVLLDVINGKERPEKTMVERPVMSLPRK